MIERHYRRRRVLCAVARAHSAQQHTLVEKKGRQSFVFVSLCLLCLLLLRRCVLLGTLLVRCLPSLLLSPFFFGGGVFYFKIGFPESRA